jgi:molybdopterin converting factor small subunit
MSQDLNDFFKLLAEDKKKKKEEFDSVVGDLGLDSLFGEFANLKKETKKKKVKEEKTVKAFEKWLYSEAPKEQEQIIEDVIEQSLDEVLEVLEDHKEELIEKSLGLLAEPSNVKVQQDPITPLDQKFATLDDLQKHYSTFLSRIQQQLSTIGGGGETRLRYLDDVVGIATNSGAYDGKYLQWNSTTNRAEFTDPSDSETITIVSVTGITTYYQATNTDDYIGVNANVPVIIQLPPSPITGKKLIVKDEGNKISLHNITVTVGAGVSVENDTSVVMKINHQSFTYFYNGSNWFLV